MLACHMECDFEMHAGVPFGMRFCNAMLNGIVGMLFRNAIWNYMLKCELG